MQYLFENMKIKLIKKPTTDSRNSFLLFSMAAPPPEFALAGKTKKQDYQKLVSCFRKPGFSFMKNP